MKLEFKPLKQPLTVYRAISPEFDTEGEFTNAEPTSFTTDKSLLEGLGKIVSLELPVGTPAAQLKEDGEVVIDKGATFDLEGNTLKLVGEQDKQQREQQKMQKEQDRALLSQMPSNVNFNEPPPLPASISDYLDQIEYIGDVPNWEDNPALTDNDGEEDDTLFGYGFDGSIDSGDSDELDSSGQRASIQLPVAPQRVATDDKQSAPLDLAPIATALNAVAQALAASKTTDLSPLIQAIAQQKAPQVTLPEIKMPEIQVSVPSVDWSPLMKAFTTAVQELKTPSLDVKEIVKAFRDLPAPQITVEAAQPMNLELLARSLLEAVRSMPAPQITVTQPERPLLRNVKFTLDDEGNATGATLN